MPLSLKKTHTLATTILALIVVIGLALPAQAQEEVLEEVIVTAQRIEQNVNEIGMSITVFSGQTLRDQGIYSTEQLSLITPGLQVNEVAAIGVPVYTIRGVGFQDLSTAASSTVGLYADDVNIPYAVMSRGILFDLDRIEVLKGPQGDLYGRNTTAGQISYVSKKPTMEYEAGVVAGYSSYETFDLEGYVSGPLGDSVQGRLSFRSLQSGEGWQKDLTSDDELGKLDTIAVRGFLDFDITDTISLRFKAHYSKDQSDNQVPTAFNGLDAGLDQPFNFPYIPVHLYLDPETGGFREQPPWYSTGDAEAASWTNTWTSSVTGTTWDLRPERDNELKGFSANLSWEIDDLTLVSITGYDEFERDDTFDSDGGSFVDGSNKTETDIETFSQEIRLQSQTENLSWIAGLYYSHDEMNEAYRLFMADSLFGDAGAIFDVSPFDVTPIYTVDNQYNQETESKAVFGHLEWSFSERFKLILGGRYTDEDRKFFGCSYDGGDGGIAGFWNATFGATLQPGDCMLLDDDPASPLFFGKLIGTANINDAFHEVDDSINTQAWMWKIGLDYAINHSSLVYGVISRGFKSGGFNGVSAQTTTQWQPYDKETLTSYEIGTKLGLLDNTMQLNLAAFYYDYKDKQESDTFVTPAGSLIGLTNVPKSEITGVELEWLWLPVDGLNLSLMASWLDSEIKEWDAVDPSSVWPDVQTFDASGSELPMTPDWSYSAVASYRWNFGNGVHLDLAGDVYYTGETTGGTKAYTATEDYTIVNTRITLGSESGSWYAQAWCRNLTDEYYYTSSMTSNGPYARILGMPRTMGITVGFNFGGGT